MNRAKESEIWHLWQRQMGLTGWMSAESGSKYMEGVTLRLWKLYKRKKTNVISGKKRHPMHISNCMPGSGVSGQLPVGLHECQTAPVYILSWLFCMYQQSAGTHHLSVENVDIWDTVKYFHQLHHCRLVIRKAWNVTFILLTMFEHIRTL